MSRPASYGDVAGRPANSCSVLPPRRYRRPRYGRLTIAIIAVALVGCASDPTLPPETRTTTVEVKVPVPVPCFSEADRPVAPVPTPIDIDHATTDQMADAIAADNAADELYMRQLEALFVQCQTTKGVAPK